MYVPPAELADQFKHAADLRIHYDTFHRTWRPRFLAGTLRQLGLRPKPNWAALAVDLRRLDTDIRACVTSIEQHLRRMQNELGSVPEELQLPYRLVVATANCVLGLRAIVDSLEAAADDPAVYPIQAMMVQQRHYRQKRAELAAASAACDALLT